jgi:hypothetical protein
MLVASAALTGSTGFGLGACSSPTLSCPDHAPIVAYAQTPGFIGASQKCGSDDVGCFYADPCGRELWCYCHHGDGSWGCNASETPCAECKSTSYSSCLSDETRFVRSGYPTAGWTPGVPSSSSADGGAD